MLSAPLLIRSVLTVSMYIQNWSLLTLQGFLLIDENFLKHDITNKKAWVIMKSFTIEFHVKLVASWVILRLMRTSYSLTMLQTKRDWVNMKSFIFEFHVKLVVSCVFSRRR